MLYDVVCRRCRRSSSSSFVGVVVRRRRRWAHAPVIHAASHFDHKKRVAWAPISMHRCSSFFYNNGAPLGGPSGHRSSAKKNVHRHRPNSGEISSSATDRVQPFHSIS